MFVFTQVGTTLLLWCPGHMMKSMKEGPLTAYYINCLELTLLHCSNSSLFYQDLSTNLLITRWHVSICFIKAWTITTTDSSPEQSGKSTAKPKMKNDHHQHSEEAIQAANILGSNPDQRYSHFKRQCSSSEWIFKIKFSVFNSSLIMSFWARRKKWEDSGDVADRGASQSLSVGFPICWRAVWACQRCVSIVPGRMGRTQESEGAGETLTAWTDLGILPPPPSPSLATGLHYFTQLLLNVHLICCTLYAAKENNILRNCRYNWVKGKPSDHFIFFLRMTSVP